MINSGFLTSSYLQLEVTIVNKEQLVTSIRSDIIHIPTGFRN